MIYHVANLNHVEVALSIRYGGEDVCYMNATVVWEKFAIKKFLSLMCLDKN